MICYLVLAHAKPSCLRRLIAELDDGVNRVVVHVDARSSLDAFQPCGSERVSWVDQRVVAYHHGWGIVEATIRALDLGVTVAPDASHFVLLSGDSYPLRTQDYIRMYLCNDPDVIYMNLLPLPAPEVLKPITKLTRYYINHDPRAHPLKVFPVKVAHRLLPTRRSYSTVMHDLPAVCGSQWWALNAPGARFVLAQIQSREDFVEFCRHTRTPDEHFFQILLGSSEFASRRRPNIMYTDFSIRPGPVSISDRHVDEWLDSGKASRHDEYGYHDEFLFARKFNDDSAALTARIRRELYRPYVS
jgi:Core-2/I-Branching enzyme